MDYERFFSEDVAAFLPSPTRELFKKVDISKIYSLAGGFPSPDTFPLDGMRALVDSVLHKYGARAMQYGGTQGTAELVALLAESCGEESGNLQVTTSSQQGIDMCARLLLDPGDVVLVDAPSYLGALQSIRDYRARAVPFAEGYTVPEDAAKVKFAYVIPDFGNPSGRTMTLQERQELVRQAREKDFLIVEDSPYRALRYEGDDVPTIRSMAPERTVQLCSFSKIFAPGFRLGWMAGPPEFIHQVYVCKQALDLCPPVFDQYLAAEFMGSGALGRSLACSKEYYRRNRDLLLDSLHRHMPPGVSWTRPEGGFFTFLTLPENCDTLALYDTAIGRGVAYVPGAFFYPDGRGRNTMRLSFSYLAPEKFDPAVKLLAGLLF